MFCPKCGLQNTDNTKFCRNCGANLSDVLAVVEGKMLDRLPQLQEYNELFSSGIRNLIFGFGFLFISLLLFTMPGNTIFWLLMMIPAISLLATGIPRIIKANGMKAKKFEDVVQSNSFPATNSNPTLPPIQTDYIKPRQSFDEASHLAGQPLSVTEPTTRQLQMDSDGDEKILPKKQL